MRILHLYKDYFPVLGGIENHIRVLAEAQAGAGHDVTVLVCDPGSRTRTEDRNGVHVIKAARFTTVASMPISLAQPLVLARQRPDLIHVHSPYPLGETGAYILGRRPGLILTHHSDVVRQRGWLRLYGPLLRQVYRSADIVIATSRPYVETSPWLSRVGDKCRVVPLGVDESWFVPPASPRSGPPGLLFAGRLRYYKGLDTLLRVVASLPQAHLTVVGGGPMRGPWEALANGLGMADRVRFCGEIGAAALRSAYQEAHVFVLPANARAEAFGTVLLEAMASGLPCITTEVGTGTSWVVQDGVTGIVVPPRDEPALADAIDSLVRDRERRQEMGRAARARVEAEFTQSRMIAGVQAVYDRVLGACASTRFR